MHRDTRGARRRCRERAAPHRRRISGASPTRRRARAAVDRSRRGARVSECGRLTLVATRAAVETGARDLARRDPVLKKMLRDHGVPEIHRRRPRRPHFAELARMICYQQLAGRAAAAIHGRFEALFDGPPTPEAVLALPVETLRAAGLSGAKAASIRDLAEKAEAGLVELDRIARLPDDEVVRELVLVRGIGEWTAHM